VNYFPLERYLIRGTFYNLKINNIAAIYYNLDSKQ